MRSLLLFSFRRSAPRPATYLAARSYAVQAPGAPTLEVFNRHTKWLQRERTGADVEASRSVDYLRDEVASRLCERLLVSLWPPSAVRHVADISRTSTVNSLTSWTLVPMPAT